MDDRSEPARHTKHVYRVLILLGLFVVAALAVRYALIPPGWGTHGNFRAGAVQEMLDIDPVHGGREACRPCHGKEWETVQSSDHASVSCESCHEPLAHHVQGGRRRAPMPTDRSYALCARCHRRIEGRPADFPQVRIDEHVLEQGGSFGAEVCLDCHTPHAPLDGLR